MELLQTIAMLCATVVSTSYGSTDNAKDVLVCQKQYLKCIRTFHPKDIELKHVSSNVVEDCILKREIK